MSKPKMAAIAAAALLLAFLAGFLPQWSRARALEGELERTRFELALSRLEGRLGAALAEAQRSNYERARQLMTGVFSELQERTVFIEPPARRGELEAVLAERDEIITLLSRADPEATQRLNLIYTRFFAAVNPAMREAPGAVTPPPPPRAPPSP
jgi:hypothetical protein